MDRSEMIDSIYHFIMKHFDIYYWKTARKYNYFNIDFAKYNSYNDFMLCQEITLYTKSDDELVFLYTLMKLIDSNNIEVMDSNRMHPEISRCFIFDKDGNVIIANDIS